MKFLGLIVDECLTWKEHSNRVLNKIKTNKKLLMNAKNLLDTKSLGVVYHAHIYSHLTYGLVIWGSMFNQQSVDELFKIQKQCIQTVMKRGQKDHTDPMFRQLKSLRFPDMIKTEQAKLGYKVRRSMLPKPIHDLFDVNGGKKVHRYPTRNKTLPNIQQHMNSTFNQSFMCKCLSVNMSLPGITKQAPILASFVNRLKNQLKA